MIATVVPIEPSWGGERDRQQPGLFPDMGKLLIIKGHSPDLVLPVAELGGTT
jgi:hypothetical protein